MPSAIVVGATGILGREIVRELSNRRDQWSTIYALSRSKKEDYPENVVHSHVDLLSSAEDMVKDLADVRAEYIFFAAYLQKGSEQENWDVNGAMLSNFLEALVKTGAANDVHRVILVTGAKQYGVHLGVPKQPMQEDDLWLTDSKWPPNFYYNQQNILHDFCTKHHKEWVVTYPNDVIGFAVGNFMNLSLALALYVIVSKELSSDGLVFPGSPTFYSKFDSFTSSKLHAEFCAWVALEPKAANQAFNVVNGDTESWQHLFPRVASYFGTNINSEQFASAYASSAGTTLKNVVMGFSSGSSSSNLAPEPPITTSAAQTGLIGTPAIAQSKVEQHVDLINWSQRPDVKAAWTQIAHRNGLDEGTFEKATWGFLGFVLGRNFDLVISMSKARQYGWTGYRDTFGSLAEVFDELKDARLIPRA